MLFAQNKKYRQIDYFLLESLQSIPFLLSFASLIGLWPCWDAGLKSNISTSVLTDKPCTYTIDGSS